jgi:hypothetical protein
MQNYSFYSLAKRKAKMIEKISKRKALFISTCGYVNLTLWKMARL